MLDTFQIGEFRAPVLHSVTPARAAAIEVERVFLTRGSAIEIGCSSFIVSCVPERPPKGGPAPKRARTHSRQANAKGSWSVRTDERCRRLHGSPSGRKRFGAF